jgi:hypothetical protein
MDTQLKNQQQDKFVKVTVSANTDGFNFELWAREVRPLLLAVVQKRTKKL